MLHGLGDSDPTQRSDKGFALSTPTWPSAHKHGLNIDISDYRQFSEERDDPPIELSGLEHDAVNNGKLDVTKFCDLANTTNKLDTSFERAYRLLLKIDCHKYAREAGTIVEYASTWRQYQETFRQLITESKNIASTGKCYAERYAHEVPEKLEKLCKIIEDPRTEMESFEETRKRANKTMQLIEASINVLLKDMADTEKRATELGAKLSELLNGVKILSEELERDVDCLTTAVDIDVTIKAAEEHIRNVQIKLDKLKAKVSTLFGVAAVSFTIGGGIGWVAGARCASGIFPTLGLRARDALCVLGTVLSGVGIDDLGNTKTSKNELRTAKENLEVLGRKRDALAQSKTDVNAIQEEVHTIAIQLGTIMKIWSSIQSDAVQLKGWLKGCLNPDVPVEDVARDLSEMKIGLVYGILCQVLQTYATEVNVSTLKPVNT
ncbi:hypothetical protein EST38_g1791 [Candolleomyces aberdarensis]|uniref:Uncharacterized protein n=1 Tax=Candolleomyces aberdarensis TaxID=2316362 RepID=A0A4Q2DW90_9AGAR|nr:hypothetical protein EST38_g1791 [Candolleomyces aberdarensis]